MKLTSSAHISRALSRFRNSERGSSVVELAIVFPILLLLFVGTAELGRLFYTYTTLAKATKVGARYLSTQKEAESTDAAVTTPLKTRVASLVVCGFTSCTTPDGAARPAIVSGLQTSNVLVTLPPTSAIGPKYVKVEIQNFTFQPGVFNVAGATDSTSATFYFSLEPGTRMRYMH
jgi:Flp pilus assembly protein TadG